MTLYVLDFKDINAISNLKFVEKSIFYAKKKFYLKNFVLKLSLNKLHVKTVVLTVYS